MIFLAVTILISISFLILGYTMNAEITFAPVLGFIMGALYSFSDFDNGREHTLRCLIGFISITIVWEDLG